MAATSAEINLGNIQGNILAGFLKDHREMLFLQFTAPKGARGWLRGPHFVTTTGGDYFFSPSLSALWEMATDRLSS
jgi:hypothetical protein